MLVLILKLNKEAPLRKDVFRAPGHQGAMKKLIHFLQTGRLVNVDNYSVYTIASVLKKFLRKIPNGIFGREVESQLFKIIEIEDKLEQQQKIHTWVHQNTQKEEYEKAKQHEAKGEKNSSKDTKIQRSKIE